MKLTTSVLVIVDDLMTKLLVVKELRSADVEVTITGDFDKYSRLDSDTINELVNDDILDEAIP